MTSKACSKGPCIFGRTNLNWRGHPHLIIRQILNDIWRSTYTYSFLMCIDKCDQLQHSIWLACSLPPRFWFGQLDWGGVDLTRLVGCWRPERTYLHGVCLIECALIVDTLPCGSPYWIHWQSWGVLGINMRWNLKVHGCTIPRIFFLSSTISQSYFRDVSKQWRLIVDRK